MFLTFGPIAFLTTALAVVGGNPPCADDEAELSAAIGVNEVKAHVYRLASPEFLGRRGPGAARASRHIEEAFRRLGLEPAFGDSFFQAIPSLVTREDDEPPAFLGRNVAAVLPGSDPELRDEWVILSAHLDHLGKPGDVLYPGADDNASGLAMLLEVAEWFALRKDRPRRSVMFVAFDLEESALLGSTHFAAHPPRDFKKLKAFFTADMLGRSMANVMREYVFVLGAETAPQLQQAVKDTPPEAGLKLGTIGADIIGTRGDYGPFRDRRIPFLFFSTGQHPDYHRPSDTPDRLDYEKLARASRWIAELTWHVADAEQAPVWSETTAAGMAEARTILRLISRIEKMSATLSAAQRVSLQGFHEKLADIVKRGTITDSEREWLVWMTRLLLMTVFR
jgi:hypothetical protein